MKRFVLLWTAVSLLLLFGCSRQETTSDDRLPALMVEGTLYLDTGKQIPVEMEESAILGQITDSVGQNELPEENGQSNFGCIGAEYAYFSDGVVVLINHEWQFFEPAA